SPTWTCARRARPGPAARLGRRGRARRSARAGTRCGGAWVCLLPWVGVRARNETKPPVRTQAPTRVLAVRRHCPVRPGRVPSAAATRSPTRGSVLIDAAPGRPLVVAFGTIPAAMPGGIAATEHLFQAALARTGRVAPLALPFGRREHGQGPAARLLEGMADLARFAALVVRRRPDLVHLDSAFDHRALVRDAAYAVVARALGQKLFVK